VTTRRWKDKTSSSRRSKSRPAPYCIAGCCHLV